uniref:RNA-directed RNA polymerase n=1 Tax=Nanning Totiv tick virus 2 TaxID=2972353 RepID=A0A9E7V2I9_9VIRU|nr:MAG: RNA-dependent RNA polymerase [Nanning Totiv tick virus 2]
MVKSVLNAALTEAFGLVFPAVLSLFASLAPLAFLTIEGIRQIVPQSFSALSLSTQYEYLLSLLPYVSVQLAVVLHTCALHYPMQMGFQQAGFDWLVETFCSTVTSSRKTGRTSAAPAMFGSLPWCKERYRIKAHPGALTKVGMYAHDAFRALFAQPAAVSRLLCEHWHSLEGLTDDQVAGVLTYYMVCGPSLGYARALDLALLGATQPDHAKALSTAIKSLGWNATSLGSRVCELNTLAGRGVGAVDMHKEIRRRSGAGGRATVVNVAPEELEWAIGQVYDEELGAVAYTGFDSWFNLRWLKMANGAHSAAAGRYGNHTTAQPVRKVGARMHRKAFAEQVTLADAYTWTGDVVVTPSAKLEHGKTRALFSCDSVSMMWFAHLFEAAESAWGNHHSILDPGAAGTIGMGKLLYKMKRARTICLMADYDDFNSQHSLMAQQLVVDLLCARVGVPAGVRARLVSSFERMYIVVGGVATRVTGTLMSGHRGTSFINTVLNRAYMLIAHKRAGVPATCKHVGDDIVAAFNDLNEVQRVMAEASMLGLRLNRNKQSIGTYGMEFLRVAYDNRGNAYGYVARAIAAFVSGSWTSPTGLDPLEVVQNGIASVYTIGNRVGDRDVWRMFTYAVARRAQMPLDTVADLLSGRVALADGPVFCAANVIESRAVGVVVRPLNTTPAADYLGLPDHATADYAAHTENEIDRALVATTNTTWRAALLESSYYKDKHSSGAAAHVATSVRPKVTLALKSCVGTDQLLSTRTLGSDLRSSPVFMAMYRITRPKDMERLVKAALPRYSGYAWQRAVEGSQVGRNSFCGWLPYADMMALNSRVHLCRVIHDVNDYYV